MKAFALKDFPIGSNLILFRKCDIQVNPSSRKKGEKRFFKDFAYSKLKITHYVGNSLVGTEYDNSNEGFCIKNTRFFEGFFILPESLFKILKGIPVITNLSKEELLLTELLGTDFPPINYIVRNTFTEIKGTRQKVFWRDYKNPQRVYQDFSDLFFK